MRAFYKLSWIPSLMVIVGLVFISSCKDDEKPKSKLSFQISEEDIAESDGTIESFHPLLINGSTGRDIEVKILLDRPLDETAVIAFTVEGTATKNTASQIGDFEIKGNSDYVTIGPGATEATLTITVFEDFDFEIDNDNNVFETITITLTSVVSGPAELTQGTQNIYTLTIFEDDTLLLLGWDDGSGSEGDVDMDLFLWLDDPETAAEDFDILGNSSQAGNASEGLVIPGGFPSGKYGMSYTYYSGASDDLEFTVDLVNLGGTLNGGTSDLSFTGNYTTANLNVYDDDTDPNHKGAPEIVQTMVKDGLNYSSISDITEISGSSRTNTFDTKPIDVKSLKGDLKLIFTK